MPVVRLFFRRQKGIRVRLNIESYGLPKLQEPVGRMDFVYYDHRPRVCR